MFSQSLISLHLIEDFLADSHRARDPSAFKGSILLMGEENNELRGNACLYFYAFFSSLCLNFLQRAAGLKMLIITASMVPPVPH